MTTPRYDKAYVDGLLRVQMATTFGVAGKLSRHLCTGCFFHNNDHASCPKNASNFLRCTPESGEGDHAIYIHDTDEGRAAYVLMKLETS